MHQTVSVAAPRAVLCHAHTYMSMCRRRSVGTWPGVRTGRRCTATWRRLRSGRSGLLRAFMGAQAAVTFGSQHQTCTHHTPCSQTFRSHSMHETGYAPALGFSRRRHSHACDCTHLREWHTNASQKSLLCVCMCVWWGVPGTLVASRAAERRNDIPDCTLHCDKCEVDQRCFRQPTHHAHHRARTTRLMPVACRVGCGTKQSPPTHFVRPHCDTQPCSHADAAEHASCCPTKRPSLPARTWATVAWRRRSNRTPGTSAVRRTGHTPCPSASCDGWIIGRGRQHATSCCEQNTPAPVGFTYVAWELGEIMLRPGKSTRADGLLHLLLSLLLLARTSLAHKATHQAPTAATTTQRPPDMSQPHRSNTITTEEVAPAPFSWALFPHTA